MEVALGEVVGMATNLLGDTSLLALGSKRTCLEVRAISLGGIG